MAAFVWALVMDVLGAVADQLQCSSTGWGDSSWSMTLLTFGPRRVWLVPLAPLAAGAFVFCRRALLPLLLGLWCGLGPLMGFCVPWAQPP